MLFKKCFTTVPSTTECYSWLAVKIHFGFQILDFKIGKCHCNSAIVLTYIIYLVKYVNLDLFVLQVATTVATYIAYLKFI